MATEILGFGTPGRTKAGYLMIAFESAKSGLFYRTVIEPDTLEHEILREADGPRDAVYFGTEKATTSNPVVTESAEHRDNALATFRHPYGDSILFIRPLKNHDGPMELADEPVEPALAYVDGNTGTVTEVTYAEALNILDPSGSDRDLPDDTWALEFPTLLGNDGGPPTFIPNSLRLKQQRGKLDFCRMEFETKVGDNLKPHTRTGALTDEVPVVITHDGNIVKRMLFKPNSVRYGNTQTRIEVYDYQQALHNGSVDKKWQKVTLKDAYTHVFNQAETNRYNEIKFPDEFENLTLIGDDSEAGNANSATGGFIESEHGGRYTDETDRVVNGKFAVEFDDITPLEAIWKLNGDYALHTWTDDDQNLWVGQPELNARRHVAAPDDERVWRYTDLQVRHPRDAIKKMVVKGAWVDQPGWNLEGEWKQWFNPMKGGEDNNVFGSGDLHATAVVERTDIDHGITIERQTNAKKESIKPVARLAFFEEIRNQNSGSVDINPAKSGTFTTFESLEVGDFLHVVPNDDPFLDREEITATTGEIGDDIDLPEEFCGQEVKNEVYLIEGITHHVDGSGDWSISLDIALWPYDIGKNLTTQFYYYDPEGDDYLSEDEATTHGFESV